MRSLIALLLSIFAFNMALASEGQYLPELLSPEELAQEMGIGANEGFIDNSLSAVESNARLQIFVDKARQGRSSTAQTMQIYLDGVLIHNLLVSTGREKQELAKSGRTYFSSTPTGTFKIIRRSRNHFSQTWQAPMPYAQFLIGGIAIHATTKDHYSELGSRASGGCVRVRYEDAKMIWGLVDEVGVDQVSVTISDNSN